MCSYCVLSVVADVPFDEHRELFIKKLRVSCAMFDFTMDTVGLSQAGFMDVDCMVGRTLI